MVVVGIIMSYKKSRNKTLSMVNKISQFNKELKKFTEELESFSEPENTYQRKLYENYTCNIMNNIRNVLRESIGDLKRLEDALNVTTKRVIKWPKKLNSTDYKLIHSKHYFSDNSFLIKIPKVPSVDGICNIKIYDAEHKECFAKDGLYSPHHLDFNHSGGCLDLTKDGALNSITPKRPLLTSLMNGTQSIGGQAYTKNGGSVEFDFIVYEDHIKKLIEDNPQKIKTINNVINVVNGYVYTDKRSHVDNYHQEEVDDCDSDCSSESNCTFTCFI